MKFPSPYPYFGGKAIVAEVVWRRFGSVKNYVEPFFGGGSILLKHPDPQGFETVNDLDCYIANLWRAIKHDAESVKHHAVYPVIEIDIHSRNLWLINNRPNYQELLIADPEFYDAKVAGWWLHGQAHWLGSAFASKPYKQIPGLTSQRGFMSTRIKNIDEYFNILYQRLEKVRVLCGDWLRCVASSITENIGTTAIFLDPPYSSELCDQGVYAIKGDVSTAVRNWAIENGNNPALRIALCGYKNEHGEAMPSDWECYSWVANGGFGNQGNKRGRENRSKETIWFSPYCLKNNDLPLFEGI